MSLDDLDPLLAQPKRLACLGAVAAASKVEFSSLRELLELSDSDLSKQLKVLSDAGYITSAKSGRGATRRTWLSITGIGRTALADHTEALRKLVDPAEVTSRLRI